MFVVIEVSSSHNLMCRNKKETRSYVEILKTVGIDRPADMLFVTDDFREAVAAAAAGNELLVALKFTFILVLCVAIVLFYIEFARLTLLV